MKRLWHGWVERCYRPVDTRAYALTRIGLAACVLADLLDLVRVGLLSEVFREFEHGGVSGFHGRDWVLGFLGPEAGVITAGVVLVSMTAVMLGVAVRPAILVGVLAYAQLGALYPPGDRGVDRIIRTMLLILLFSASHRRWALGDRLRGRPAQLEAPAWPAELATFVVVIIYLCAGLNKIGNTGWLSLDRVPMLYRVLTDPLAANLDHRSWKEYMPLFRVGSWGTVLLELSAPLLLTRLAPGWAILGVLMHLGIAITMGLGIFSWGMLSLYPLLLAPWLSALMRSPSVRAPDPDARPRQWSRWRWRRQAGG